MISSWLLKIVLGIALFGVVVLEAGSPLVARAQADDAANQIADEAAFRLRTTFTQQELQDACSEEAAKLHVKIVTCAYESGPDEVVVRVQKDALSLVLKNWSVTEDWYRPQVTARSELR